jgi:hypothetical protein
MNQLAPLHLRPPFLDLSRAAPGTCSDARLLQLPSPQSQHPARLPRGRPVVLRVSAEVGIADLTQVEPVHVAAFVEAQLQPPAQVPRLYPSHMLLQNPGDLLFETYNPSVNSCTDRETAKYRRLRLILKNMPVTVFSGATKCCQFSRRLPQKVPKVFSTPDRIQSPQKP